MSSPAAEVDDHPLLQDRLCLALHRATRAVDGAYRPHLDALDLTYPQHLLLVALLQGGRSSVGDVGDRLGLVSSTLSPLITRLETRGLVQRERSTADSRRVEIGLTDAGRELARRASGVNDVVCAATGLDDGSVRTLIQQLQQLEATLTAHGAPVGDGAAESEASVPASRTGSADSGSAA